MLKYGILRNILLWVISEEKNSTDEGLRKGDNSGHFNPIEETFGTLGCPIMKQYSSLNTRLSHSDSVLHKHLSQLSWRINNLRNKVEKKTIPVLFFSSFNEHEHLTHTVSQNLYFYKL